MRAARLLPGWRRDLDPIGAGRDPNLGVELGVQAAAGLQIHQLFVKGAAQNRRHRLKRAMTDLFNANYAKIQQR